MLKQFLTTICCCAVMTGVAGAQAATPPGQAQAQPAPERAAAPSKPPEPSQPLNIRLELTILDQTGPGEPSRKVVTMNVADRFSASIRTSGWVLTKEGRRDVSINVDARPIVLRNKEGAVQLELGLSYQPTGLAAAAGSTAASADAGSAQTGLNERITTILENGKPLLVSQASDPSLDRRISVEVKATILK
jgi:hypothetical protein